MNQIENLLKNINKAINPFHAVKVISDILEENGFLRLFEASKFNLEKGKGYYVVRNDASVIAWKMPEEEVEYFKITASHLDSPCFKIKPNGMINTAGFNLLNTEVYGGPILSSWFDRPLGISGRVIINKDNKIITKLVDFKDACVIPNIAIHLNREVNSGYNYNTQVDTLPIYGVGTSNFNDYLLKELNITQEELKAFDLYIYNDQEGKVIGIDKDLFISPRIDNLECAFTSLEAFLNAKESNNACNMYASFNHEEVGSSSNHGANSTFLIDVISRISNNSDVEIKLAKSIIVSADNAHSIHPAAVGKADPTNSVMMNKGIVIKNAANLSYTTDALSKGIFKSILDNANVVYQENTNRSNLRGGSTLGCISLSHVSITSIDIGLAQLAMHSACETAGTKDVTYMVEGLTAFYNTNIIIKEKEIVLN